MSKVKMIAGSIGRIILFTIIIGSIFGTAVWLFWGLRNDTVNEFESHDEWIQITADYYDSYEIVEEHHYSKDDRKKPTDETYYVQKYSYVVDGKTHYYTTNKSIMNRPSDHIDLYYAKDDPGVSRTNLDISGGILFADILIGILSGFAFGLWLGLVALQIKRIMMYGKGVDPVREELRNNYRMSN